jgi:hypothetical protein
MSNYPEPRILAECDRSFGDKHEKLRLEQDEYKGQPTFTLRVVWQGNDGNWRWSQARPSEKTGKVFQALHLKANELESLGKALIAAGQSAHRRSQQPAKELAHDDDIPF